MRVVPLLAVASVLALAPVAHADEAAPPKRECGSITAVGDRMHVRAFSRPFVKCTTARSLMRRTFKDVKPNGKRQRLGGWRCAWRMDDVGGISADCARGKLLVMAWNADYGE
jgi:hypothetical protein